MTPTFETTHPVPGTTELAVHGEIDLRSGRRLEEALQTAMADGGRVLVDLRGCTFMDSTGLSALLRAARSAPQPGRLAVFCAPEASVRHVFSLTRAHTLLGLHDDRTAALAAVSI